MPKMNVQKIFNTLAREKQVFEPMEAGKVRMYFMITALLGMVA
jgi:hypothetical protein